jgi:post-segregation antitoxin (ccd killing protein)
MDENTEKYLLTMNPKLREQLEAQAKREGLFISQVARKAIAKYIQEEQALEEKRLAK